MASTKGQTKGNSTKIKGLLKKGGYAEGAELTETQRNGLNALPKDATAKQVDGVMKAGSRDRSTRGSSTGTRSHSQKVRDLAKQATAVDGPKYPIPAKSAEAVSKAAKDAPKIPAAKLKKFAKTGAGLTEKDAKALAEFTASSKVAPGFKHPKATTDQRQAARVLVAIEEAAA